MSWGPSSLSGPSLHSRWGMAVASSPWNCQCLTVEWNCCLCTTNHLNFHIIDLMWWVVISLKKCVNFPSQVEHDIIYPVSFSGSAVSDGTQMLPCISPSGPPQGRVWEGSQWGSWSYPSTWAASTRAASHLMSFASWDFFPLMFYLLLRESAESGFTGSENSKTSADIILYEFERERNYARICHMCSKKIIWLVIF